MAAKEGADLIVPRMLDQAFDKIRMGVERKSVRRTEEGRKRTAYHEAGHAIVALNVPGASPIHKATIMPRGHALGMVTQARAGMLGARGPHCLVSGPRMSSQGWLQLHKRVWGGVHGLMCR